MGDLVLTPFIIATDLSVKAQSRYNRIGFIALYSSIIISNDRHHDSNEALRTVTDLGDGVLGVLGEDNFNDPLSTLIPNGILNFLGV